MTARRATDSHAVLAWWGRWGRDVVTMIAVGLAAFAIWQQTQESETRRDQLCTIFERNEAKDIEQLRATYDYLVHLSRKQRREPLNAAVLAQLPKTELEARTPDAPAYCNDPNVGLPEPGPRIPRRPPALNPQRRNP